MRKSYSILIILILVASGFGFMDLFDIAQENVTAFKIVGGTYTTDQTWTLADSPFYVTSTVTIDNGATLTIAPDVDVLFNNTYSLIINNGNLRAVGTKSQPIRFNKTTSGGNDWSTIEIRQSGSAEFDRCIFANVSAAITLVNNEYKTTVANSTFDSTCSDYFDLDLGSKINVTSSKFADQAFENNSVLTNNLNNKIIINDPNSEIYIQYFVNVNTVDGYMSPLKNINVDVSDTRNTRIGRTDTNGQFWYNPVTACKISGTTPAAMFSYPGTIVVSDKWAGAGPPFEETGISINQTIPPINSSSWIKNNDLYISLTFMFKYPPKIDTGFSSKIKVKEDTNTSVTFSIHDNDDLEFNYGFNNLTINITDQLGRGIYGSNTLDKWISWSNTSGGQLHFYRTIESPFSPPIPDDYDAVVNEQIYITIIDPHGQKDTLGPVDIEFTNVPDKPVLTGLPSATEVTYVTEDVEKKIPIIVTDNDNSSADIRVYTNSQYVTYEYVTPTVQNLILLFPNEFGPDGKQVQVYANATDGCSDEVVYSFLISFTQTPDPPVIMGPIPDKWGDEVTWEPDMVLGKYAFDVDPDDDFLTLDWYVTGLDKKVFGIQLFTVSNENSTANAPLSFNLNPELELGGAREPLTIDEKITIWLEDKDGLKASQNVSLHINSTNQPPSLHKIDYQNSKTTVIPESGNVTETFRFLIEYKDNDGRLGDAPEYVRVYIDGNPYEMTEVDPNDDDYRDGKVYEYFASALSVGIHEHYFECSDTRAVTRFPWVTAFPKNITGPEVQSTIFIMQESSPDGNFIIRLAHMNIDASAEVIEAIKPQAELEPNKDEVNKTKDDIGMFFKIETLNLDYILWLEVTVKFGSDYSNYDTTWLRKQDLQLGYYSPINNEWFILPQSVMNTKTQTMKCNLTPVLSYEPLLDYMLNSTTRPVFTVVGTLDADNDGYFNSRDAFPFDPAASLDTDSDGAPDKWNPQKSAKDSTTGLYLDAFKNDISASKDADNDNCPDIWNTGMSQADSTSNPKLTLDRFLDNPGACADTDLDGLPDIIIKEKNTQPELIEDTDDDNDGLPDTWEDEWLSYAIEHNMTPRFNPKDPSDAALDFDNDGFTNADEYKKGLNPYKKDDKDGGEDTTTANIAIIIGLIVMVILFLILFTYIKKRREDLLDNKIRAKILDYINKNPGIHYRKILKDLDLQMGVLTHHLNMLEQQDYIKSLQDSMYRRFYSISAPINTKLILSSVQQKILRLIKDIPGISQAEIARKLGLARKVVNYHIRILSDAGFVNVELDGRESQCYYLSGLDLKATVKG
jgi:DNA-binding MarR family transcriptional regulator